MSARPLEPPCRTFHASLKSRHMTSSQWAESVHTYVRPGMIVTRPGAAGPPVKCGPRAQDLGPCLSSRSKATPILLLSTSGADANEKSHTQSRPELLSADESKSGMCAGIGPACRCQAGRGGSTRRNIAELQAINCSATAIQTSPRVHLAGCPDQ